MKLILGLGNVGPQYAKTRHNAGFMVADELAEMLGGSWKNEAKLKAEVVITDHEGQKIILAKPQTMMNLSGEAAQRIMQFYKVSPADVWVVFDDVDTPFGRLRVRRGGSGSGHQGVNSLIHHIGLDFVRFKFGISLNDRAVEPSEVYVLKPFNADEQAKLPATIAATARHISDQIGQELIDESTFDV
ncbi:MAG TPA: aminoacyl-tRNA hydrolase [Candidatus Saccharimonadia bacterium]|jgi:PTH1 family peptidyl-tRNA hydrolase|nr:aminoacyl-tRNA hydrolase [Candidatus Saccharimonadia bacterium]